MKIDTEGNDFQCAARRTRHAPKWIRGSHPVRVQLQVDRRQRYLRDVFDLTADLKYGVGKVLPWGVEVYDAWHPEMERYFESNYLLVRDGFDRRIGAARFGVRPPRMPGGQVVEPGSLWGQSELPPAEWCTDPGECVVLM